jgi:hypothetical protein
VGDAGNLHDFLFVINGIDYAVIADADAPFISSAFELFAALGSGVRGERFDSWEDAD